MLERKVFAALRVTHLQPAHVYQLCHACLGQEALRGIGAGGSAPVLRESAVSAGWC